MVKGKKKISTQTPVIPGKKLRSGPPEPYGIPPPALHDFLKTLNPQHIYITHLDSHPRSKKFQVWLLTAALNILVILVVLWRANQIFPWYTQILFDMWGFDIEVHRHRHGTNGSWSEVWKRSLTFILDFCLIRYGLSWPVDFFVGSMSPLYWRINAGFKDNEVAIRRSKKWDENLKKDWIDGAEADAVHKDFIMPAVDRSWIAAKTGYLMIDQSWDLDFRAMIEVYNLIKQGKNDIDDFQKTIFIYHETFGWLVWQIWKLDEGAQTVGRQKIIELRKRLVDLDKEDLFFRWVEVIQYETSQPGGFTQERQTKAMHAARELFKSNDVDFDAIWKEIGGGTTPDLSDDS